MCGSSGLCVMAAGLIADAVVALEAVVNAAVDGPGVGLLLLVALMSNTRPVNLTEFVTGELLN